MGNNYSHDGTPTQPILIDKWAKMLAQKSLIEDSIEGITCQVFTNNVFPRYPDLSQRLFKFFGCRTSRRGHKWISSEAFKQQIEKFLRIVSNDQQIELYIRMYTEGSNVNQDQFRQLILQGYKLAMDHYPGGHHHCIQLSKILKAVVDSAFNRNSVVSVAALSRWIKEHTPRLVLGIQHSIVYVLKAACQEAWQPGSAGLERGIGLPASANMKNDILPISEVWLLSSSLPLCYTKPPQHLSSASTSGGPSSPTFIAGMLGTICPSHWTLLYNSDQHGRGISTFKHHVFGRHGPTLTFLRGQDGVQFCLATDCEWQESRNYWGWSDCAVIQILPVYHIVKRGAKMMYLNNGIAGNPKCMRAGGHDASKPIIDVNDGFTVVTYRGVRYPLISVQVWGCGIQQSRWSTSSSSSDSSSSSSDDY